MERGRTAARTGRLSPRLNSPKKNDSRPLTKLADRLFPFRWWFLVATVCSLLLIVVLVSLHRGPAAIALAGPMVGLPWTALCAATWFHPTRGNIQPSGKRFSRFPKFAQTIIRWYAAIFLAIFVVFCGVIWPLFALSALR